ncbi:hypothetical protein LG329_03390 [Virgibacillus necropolis]|uniref:hypothetical protein n=1 Tax=Virgibacillus necropolis TaxID=163877 RepID=UPI00384CB51D
MKKNSFHEYRQKVNYLNEKTITYIAEIKENLNHYEKSQDFNVLCYFTYSLNLSDDKKVDNLSIGSFHILNIGNQPLTNPYICIKLSPKDLFTFSGKYLYNKPNQLMNSPDAWERINDRDEKEEYWLKPVGIKTIEPSQKISFSNFQVKWPPQKSYFGSITGFVYCDEFKDGKAAINQFSVSGTIRERGEMNDEERKS